MISGRLAEAAETVRGRVVGSDAAFRGLSTDTRTLKPGELFVALDGPSFSGRDFIPAAAENGAAGAIVSGATGGELTQIDVSDTRRALGDLGADWRRRMNPRVVGLTGSNGKTTLKELIASCLARAAKTLATEGNLNNDIGVPLMLSRIGSEHRYAVIEMGANHAGEIAYLTELAAPEVVAITNAGPAHLEGFGSIEGVAHAKGEILRGTRRPDAAILNADDQYFGLWRSFASDVPILSFGVEQPADVRAKLLDETADGLTLELSLPADRIVVRLPLAGRHNLLNAAAAAAVAVALEIDSATIVEGLESARPVSGRLQTVQLASGTTLFDDSYNANPASVIAAARFLAAQEGTRWLVLGDMAELGPEAAAMHREVGQEAQSAGVERLFAIGELSRNTVAGFGSDGRWYRTIDELVEALRGALAQSDAAVSVLVKGSRSMGMERVVAALKAAAEGGGA